MSGRVVHFEIPFDDGDRARAFYGSVFGWSIMAMPERQNGRRWKMILQFAKPFTGILSAPKHVTRL